MAVETEIKFRVADLDALAQRLQSAGFRIETPRSFESNVLYDNPGRSLRLKRELEIGRASCRERVCLAV